MLPNNIYNNFVLKFSTILGNQVKDYCDDFYDHPITIRSSVY